MVLLAMAMVSLLAGTGVRSAAAGGGKCILAVGEAAAILGVAPEEVQERRVEQPVSPDDRKAHVYRVAPYSCWFRAGGDFRRTIGYTISLFNDPGRAEQAFADMRGGFATVAGVAPVPGLGDAAFRVDDSRFHRLVARKGGALVDIRTPADHDAQARIMRLILRGL